MKRSQAALLLFASGVLSACAAPDHLIPGAYAPAFAGGELLTLAGGELSVHGLGEATQELRKHPQPHAIRELRYEEERRQLVFRGEGEYRVWSWPEAQELFSHYLDLRDLSPDRSRGLTLSGDSLFDVVDPKGFVVQSPRLPAPPNTPGVFDQVKENFKLSLYETIGSESGLTKFLQALWSEAEPPPTLDARFLEAPSPEEARVAFVRAGEVVIWSPPTDESSPGQLERVAAGSAIARHGSLLFGVTQEEVWAYDVVARRERWRVPLPHPGRVNGLVLDAEGTRLATSECQGESFAVYDAASGELLQTTLLSGLFTKVVVTKGHCAVYDWREKRVLVWDLGSTAPPFARPDEREYADDRWQPFALSADGAWLALQGPDGVEVWRTQR